MVFPPNQQLPVAGLPRRHFLSHLAGMAALAGPASCFTRSLLANAADLKKRHKSAILLWMGWRPEHHGYLGSQAGAGDRRAV